MLGFVSQNGEEEGPICWDGVLGTVAEGCDEEAIQYERDGKEAALELSRVVVKGGEVDVGFR